MSYGPAWKSYSCAHYRYLRALSANPYPPAPRPGLQQRDPLCITIVIVVQNDSEETCQTELFRIEHSFFHDTFGISVMNVMVKSVC